MFCLQCGAEAPARAVLCPTCGHDLGRSSADLRSSLALADMPLAPSVSLPGAAIARALPTIRAGDLDRPGLPQDTPWTCAPRRPPGHGSRPLSALERRPRTALYAASDGGIRHCLAALAGWTATDASQVAPEHDLGDLSYPDRRDLPGCGSDILGESDPVANRPDPFLIHRHCPRDSCRPRLRPLRIPHRRRRAGGTWLLSAACCRPSACPGTGAAASSRGNSAGGGIWTGRSLDH